jgi:hypothetical protein
MRKKLTDIVVSLAGVALWAVGASLLDDAFGEVVGAIIVVATIFAIIVGVVYLVQRTVPKN